MPTPYDIPASVFVKRLAQYLRQNVDEVTSPPWVTLVKTGAHVEKAPQSPDWWFTRSASILRKIYMEGPIGVERLRSYYGGRLNKGVRPERGRKGGGSILRKALQQLEAAGLVETLKNRGRAVTTDGRRTLDRLAGEIKADLEKKFPELKKY